MTTVLRTPEVGSVEQFDTDDFDDFLEHYGVVGMKWGQRKKGNAYDIKRARLSVDKSKGEYREAKRHARKTHRSNRGEARAKAEALKLAALKNPDRVLAARLTRGEKAVFIVLGLGAVGISGTSAISRRIEQKQDTGAYDKK